MGQMMAFCYLHGAQVIALNPAANCQPLVWQRLSWRLIMMWMLCVRRLSDRYTDPMNLKMSCWRAGCGYQEGQLLKRDRHTRDFSNRIFEKDFLSSGPSHRGTPESWLLARRRISTCRKPCSQNGDWWLRRDMGKVIRFKQTWKKPMHWRFSRLRFGKFVNFDLEISVIVSRNGKDVTVFQFGKISIATISTTRQSCQPHFG